ncbi:MAG: cell division protein FtsZ [Elusimicrobia bacterium GWA2_61_42]|nr:MAG: cell division protein FtsZ [Elusimicrobia bacterium GWA2_61_42]OGR74609.1 MAG: cell division protein FtsZ [Elusimicrobia bacterium GWC2_61_25]
MSETRIRYNNDFQNREAVIKVIGVGGGGGNAVNRMVEADIRLVEFVAVNTDAQDLRRSKAPNRIQIGENLTKGLGVGGDPAKGKEAALESAELIKEAVADADLLFVTAGMGGGTGTGAAPVVAQTAKEANPNALVIGVVTRPFGFEGKSRSDQAQAGIHELRKHSDCLLVIPNDRILSVVGRDTSSEEAYRRADDVLRQAIQGISDVITHPGLINVDFQDVKKIMTKSGEALIGIGRATGAERHIEAAKEAVHSPMLESAVIDGAKGILVSFTSSRDIKIVEIDGAMEYIIKHANPEVFIKYGQVFDENMGDELKITVIATGFPSRRGELAGDLARLRGMGRNRTRRLGDDFLPESPAPSGGREEDMEKPAYLRRQSGARRLK